MVSESQGKLMLGLLSVGVGGVGILISLFLWQDTPGRVRILGSLSRSLAEIGGTTALFSGIGLLREVGLRLKPNRRLTSASPGLLLLIVYFSIFAVVLGLVSYLATISIILQ